LDMEKEERGFFASEVFAALFPLPMDLN